MEEEGPIPGSSGTNQKRRDSTKHARDKDPQNGQSDDKEKPTQTKDDDLADFKKIFSGLDTLYKGGFERTKDRLEYVCQDCGLQFRRTSDRSDTGDLYTVVCDQLSRLAKSSDSATQEQFSPESLRKELDNFLSNPENMLYQGTGGPINLEDHLDEGETIDDWLTKMREDCGKVDDVALLALAMLKQRNIVLITAAPYTSISGPNRPMIIIPPLKKQSCDIGESILLGFYGNLRFVSLEPFVERKSSKISVTDKHSIEGYRGKYEGSTKINVEEKLASREQNNEEKHTEKIFDTMIIKPRSRNPLRIPAGKPYYIEDTEVKPFPLPVLSYEANEETLTVKWQWHNDKRHIATTVHVVGAEFIDRSGVNWCHSKIVQDEKSVDCKQYVWVHSKIDEKEVQLIDCLIPCMEYRIFLVDHFRTTLYTDTIVRTTSKMMYYTPAPAPLMLRVINTFNDKEVMIEWGLTKDISVKYIDSVELCIQNGITQATIGPQSKHHPQDELPKYFVLKEITENIKVSIKVKAKVNGCGHLSDEAKLFIMHSPKVKRPNKDGCLKTTRYKETHFCYRLGDEIHDELPEKRVTSETMSLESDMRFATISTLHTLRCGAIACQLTSQEPQQEALPLQQKAPPPQQETPLPPPQQEAPLPPPQQEAPAPQPQQETPLSQPQQEAPPPQQETPLPPPQQEAPPPQQKAPPPQQETPLPPPQQEAPLPPPQQEAPPPQQKAPPPQQEAPPQQLATATEIIPSLSSQTEHADKADRNFAGGYHLRLPLSCRIDDNSVLVGIDTELMIADLMKEKESNQKEKHMARGNKIPEVEIQNVEEKRQIEEEKRKKEEDKRRKKVKKRIEREKKRIEEENKRIEEENKRIEEEDKRIKEEKKRIEKDNQRREKEKQVYHPPAHTSIENRTRRKARGYFRILWRRPVEANLGLMCLSPYV